MKKIAIAGALAASVLLTGCGAFSAFGTAKNHDEVSYDVTEKIARLKVDSDAGNVVVNESDRSGVRVTETRHWNDDKPSTEHKVNGDTLELTYGCPVNFANCAVDYRVEIPKGVEVTVDTGSGDLTLRSLTAVGLVKTGSGDIAASGLAGKQFSAETGSGDVELKFAATPGQVKVHTGSGDATVVVPDGSYDVQADTGSGSTEVKVKDDPSAANKIVLETGSGDAKVLLG